MFDGVDFATMTPQVIAGQRRRAAGFLCAERLVRIESFVAAALPSAAATSLFAFRDEAALRNFLGDPATADLWNRVDAFLGPHGHYVSDGPLVDRAPSVSAE